MEHTTLGFWAAASADSCDWHVGTFDAPGLRKHGRNALQVLFVEPEQMQHTKPPAAVNAASEGIGWKPMSCVWIRRTS
jgi:hypothetical protein